MAPMAVKTQKHHRVFDRKNTFTLIALVIVLICCVIGFTPLSERITQGLDVQGGLSVIMTASHTDQSAVSQDEMDTTVAIIQSRVNKLGASEATVQQQGSNSILIQIPGIQDAQTALETIGTTGELEFVDLRDITDSSVVEAIESGETGMTLDAGSYTAFMKGDSLNSVSIGQEAQGSAYYAVNLDLDADGTQAFAEVTTELYPTKSQIAIVLDGVVQSAPAVQNAITNGQVAITGKYTYSQANNLKTILESGALPVSLTWSQSEVVGPTLGQASLYAGLLAAIVGFILVAIYLLIFYRGLGIITVFNLGVFAVLYLGILALLSHFGLFALSLAGIAGIVLTIGMAADSSILVLERIKEELRIGRSMKACSITAVHHGIMTSIDADVVTLVSALVLFFVAIGSVRGFGLTLALGIVCDIITMITFKAPIIRLLAPKVITEHPKFWGIADDMAEGRTAEAVAVLKGGAING